jgi:nucleoside-diphosphate-sugar epimerase
MIKKVLVVGGAGYIGGSVTDYLQKEKIPFSVLDNLIYENHYLKAVDFFKGDIRDRNKLKKLLPDYSHVIWLAAIVGDNACSLAPKLTKVVNVDSVRWLSNNFKGRIIFLSTCSVYGANEKPVTETSSTNPLSLYATTKLQAEKYLLDKNALILRLGTAFGVSDQFARIRLDLAVNFMTMNAVVNKKLFVIGGNQWRPFIHVKDIARVIVDNLDNRNKGVFNISTENASIATIAEKIQQQTGCAIERITERKYIDARDYRSDTTKASKKGVLNLKKIHTLDDGIKEIKDLVQQGRIKNLELPNYSNQRFLETYLPKYEISYYEKKESYFTVKFLNKIFFGRFDNKNEFLRK